MVSFTDNDGYTETVTSAATDAVLAAVLSTNADLSGLSLTDPNDGGAAITLDPPTFAADVTSYTATVLNSVTSVTVTPTVDDSTATFVVMVGGSEETGDISLSEGETAITVRVTAEDGATSKDYLLTVTRTPALIFTPTTIDDQPTSSTKPSPT